ncbi:MAG: 1,4-alpha-glucan branching protein GlgB [Acidimicrobiales bacterium]
MTSSRTVGALGAVDLHLLGEGRHWRLWEALGSKPGIRDGVEGTQFAVWAPNAARVSVVGDFNGWDRDSHVLDRPGSSGIWEGFVPGVGVGAGYKYAVTGPSGELKLRADPLAQEAEVPPATASIVIGPSRYRWRDAQWMAARAASRVDCRPMSVYEVHPWSWGMHDGVPPDWAGLARELPEYVASLGFTHVEMMSVAEHPFAGSWGYQVTSYYAPTGRLGHPDGLRGLVDAFHQAGVGVILDWVPAHFPKDDWALARFDGTPLYEHADPRRGEHPDWGTLVFNHGRHEVRNFLIANALYWLEEFHIDGLRVDAVASMIYLDYSRPAGTWVPNARGGREDLEAVDFLRELNQVVHDEIPGAVTAAEESTAWPGVTGAVTDGGLGFDLKWNMGWMHDTLAYFVLDPIYRRFHQNGLSFGLVYAFSEKFLLPLSHDEVVHGKKSLLAKMPGDDWQQRANLRALLAWMWAHPGRKLVFMGTELAPGWEWDHDSELGVGRDWNDPGMAGLVRSLNHTYRNTPALWRQDFAPDGFAWIDASDTGSNVLSFLRIDPEGEAPLACVANLSPVVRYNYRIGLPQSGSWIEVLNTDAVEFGGSGVGNQGRAQSTSKPWHGQKCSAELTLPPLAVLWIRPEAKC